MESRRLPQAFDHLALAVPVSHAPYSERLRHRAQTVHPGTSYRDSLSSATPAEVVRLLHRLKTLCTGQNCSFDWMRTGSGYHQETKSADDLSPRRMLNE